MPKFTLKGLWNGLFGESKYQLEDFPLSEERLRAEQFALRDVARHGFPDRPVCLALDPLQKLLAVGTYSGGLVIYGRRGVICQLQHERSSPVVEMAFLYNDGALLTVCADGFVRLWNFRQSCPEVVRSVQFQRERVTCLLVPYGSRWAYFGTERANMHVLNVESFSLSGYVVYWNRAVPLIQKSHPGILCCLRECPSDPNKLLMGFASGLITLWNLKSNSAEQHWSRGFSPTTTTPSSESAASDLSASRLKRPTSAEARPLTSLQWLHDSKHFMTSHTDGALCTWNVKTARIPVSTVFPHGKTDEDDTWAECESIRNLLCLTSREGESMLVFSGGARCDSPGAGLAAVTVVNDEKVSVAEMENDVVDIVAVVDTPFTSEEQVARAVVVLLRDTVAVLELGRTAGSVDSIPFPHPHGLHLSPVTCCHLVSDCSSQLIDDIRLAAGGAVKHGTLQESTSTPGSCGTGDGSRPVLSPSASTDVDGEGVADVGDGGWPVNGGTTGCAVLPTDSPELLLTGHSDGAIRLWSVSGAQFLLLSKIRTTRALERQRPSEHQVLLGVCEDPFAVTHISFCAASRTMTVCGAASHIVVYRFITEQTRLQIPSVEIPWPVDETLCMVNKCSSTLPQSPPVSPPPPMSPTTTTTSASGNLATDVIHEDVDAEVELAEEAQEAIGGEQETVGDHTDETDRPQPPPPDVVPVLVVQCRRSMQRFAVGFQPAIVCVPSTPSIREYSAALYNVPHTIDAVAVDPLTAVMACCSGGYIALVDIASACCLLSGSAKQLHSPFHWSTRRSQLLQQMQSAEGSSSRRASLESTLVSRLSTASGEIATASAGIGNSNRRGSIFSAANVAQMRRISGALGGAGDCVSESVVDDSPSPPTQCLITALAFTQTPLVSGSEQEKGNTVGDLRLLIGCSTGKLRLLQMATPPPVDPAVPWESDSAADTINTVCLFDGGDDESNGCALLSMVELCVSGSSALLLSRNGQWCKHRSTSGCESAADGSSASVSTPNQQTILLVTSESGVRAIELPSMGVLTQHRPAEKSKIVNSWTINMSGVACLVCFTADGWLTAHCIPSLRPLITVYLKVIDDPSVLATLSVSDRGSGVYLCSPSEIQKFTISSEDGQMVPRRRSLLFLARTPPERPSRGFVQSLLGGSRDLDRDNLFGVSAGTARHGTVESHTTSATSARANTTDRLLVHSVSAGGAIGAAHRLAVERGDKLSHLHERTEQLQADANRFASTSHQLAEKYKNKKWWQL